MLRLEKFFQTFLNLKKNWIKKLLNSEEKLPVGHLQGRPGQKSLAGHPI